jgi:hypothetical protein
MKISGNFVIGILRKNDRKDFDVDGKTLQQWLLGKEDGSLRSGLICLNTWINVNLMERR